MQDIKSIAMLCGHAAPIADLGICFPAAVPGNGMIGDLPSNVVPNSNSVNYGALISACTDGVLCVWSRGSGHCRRRRRLPPWAGSPSMVRTLPDNRRYVCVACDSVHSSDHQSLDSTEKGEASMNREIQYKKPSKCTVVIVDSYTLAIVQTVFHGNLSIGPLKFMSVILPVGDMEKQSVLMADSFGKVQCVPIINDTDPKGKNLNGAQKVPSHLEMTDWVHGTNEGGLLVAFATRGQVLALVYRTYCLFRLVDGGSTIGEISFFDDQLCHEDSASQSHVTGGMFLECYDSKMTLNSEEHNDTFLETFAVWNNRGSAIIYSVSYSGNIFKFEPLCAFPAVSHLPAMRLSICFIQLNSYLLRIESTCFHNEEPLPWKPHVTIWLLPQLHGNNGKLIQECKMLGKSSFSDHWSIHSTFRNKIEDSELNLLQSSVNVIPANDERYGHYQNEPLVSSSMVISENYYTPYAIVYGFYSGEIEVVHFHMFFKGLNSHGESDSHTSKRHLSGHTGAVLSLAAHRMVSASNRWGFNHVLVSGSNDCTIHIWDLDSSNLISVMHQHVAPVRQIVLPPPQTDRPWNDCFLSVGEDFCVAVTSLETMRVERMFPGHPYYPAKVVWDSTRGYVACLCLNDSATSDLFDVLYIWDMKTGARERVLRGTAAHSMFDHFYTGVNANTLSGSVANGNTSASSFLFPIIEDTSFSQSHLKNPGKGVTSTEPNTSQAHAGKGGAAKLYPSTLSVFQSNNHPIKCSCPFPGIATLSFDLASLISLCKNPEFSKDSTGTRDKAHVEKLEAETTKSGYRRVNSTSKGREVEMPSPRQMTTNNGSGLQGISTDTLENDDWIRSLEGCLIQFTLSILHLWDVDSELDKLLVTDMKLKRPDNFMVASGLLGDRGSLTLAFPGSSNKLEVPG